MDLISLMKLWVNLMFLSNYTRLIFLFFVLYVRLIFLI
jgi:hypothetical protein